MYYVFTDKAINNSIVRSDLKAYFLYSILWRLKQYLYNIFSIVLFMTLTYTRYKLLQRHTYLNFFVKFILTSRTAWFNHANNLYVKFKIIEKLTKTK